MVRIRSAIESSPVRVDNTDMNSQPNSLNGTDSNSGEAAAALDRRTASRRNAVADRRAGVDRRDGTADASSFDRRRGPGRRRTDYRRDAEEGHMNEEQLEFIKAIDEYKRVNHRPFPTWTELLDLALYLGYRKVAPVGEFKLTKGRKNPIESADELDDCEESLD